MNYIAWKKLYWLKETISMEKVMYNIHNETQNKCNSANCYSYQYWFLGILHQ